LAKIWTKVKWHIFYGPHCICISLLCIVAMDRSGCIEKAVSLLLSAANVMQSHDVIIRLLPWLLMTSQHDLSLVRVIAQSELVHLEKLFHCLDEGKSRFCLLWQRCCNCFIECVSDGVFWNWSVFCKVMAKTWCPTFYLFILIGLTVSFASLLASRSVSVPVPYSLLSQKHKGIENHMWCECVVVLFVS